MHSLTILASPTGQVFNTLPKRVIFALIYTRHPRKGIGINMPRPRSMSNVHIILAQLFQPSRNLALGILEVKKPNQTAMVSTNYKPASQQIMTKLPSEPHHGKQFQSGSTVSSLLFVIRNSLHRQLPFPPHF